MPQVIRHLPQSHPAYPLLHDTLGNMAEALQILADDPRLIGSDLMLSACTVYDQLFELVIDRADPRNLKH